MPQVQVVDTTQDKPEPTDVERFFTRIGQEYKDKSDRVEIGKIVDEARQNSDAAKGLREGRFALEKANISNSRRVAALKNFDEIEKNVIARDKALNAKINKGVLEADEKKRQKENLIKAGWPEYAADVYLDAPPGVKQTLEREHEYLSRHKLRKPLVTVPEGVDQQDPYSDAVASSDGSSPSGERPVFVNDPITPAEKADGVKSNPVPEKQWPAAISPSNMPPDQKVKWENNNEKENGKALKESTEAKKVLTNNRNRIKTMTDINDGKYLPDGLGRLITIDPKTGDIRPTAALAKKQNPQTALYVKNLNQYLEGIKAQLGSVISDFDIRTFKSQLPSLLNDEQGRRLILKQMNYTNELESVYNNELNETLKHYGRDANYIQISKVVGENVEEREKDLIGKINNLVEASDYISAMGDNPDKFRNIVLMQNPKGEFIYVPKEKVDRLKAKKWRDF